MLPDRFVEGGFLGFAAAIWAARQPRPALARRPWPKHRGEKAQGVASLTWPHMTNKPKAIYWGKPRSVSGEHAQFCEAGGTPGPGPLQRLVAP